MALMSNFHSQLGRSSSRKGREDATSKPPRRQATIYDAVAGRISSTGFIPAHTRTSRPRENASYLPLPPEEILFRRPTAPERYEEDDFYWAHENLDPEKQQLPDSDLLKAVHAYASDFYGKILGEEVRVSWGSLDETALMALGVLLEEEMERLLGATGDLVFVEGAQRKGDGGDGAPGRSKQTTGVRRRRREAKDRVGGPIQQREAEETLSEDEGETRENEGGDQETSSLTESSEEGRVRKRRKIVREDTDTESSA
ncbi:MAG: hypothetical protein Q9196_003398 [Gyalolechia fulgens]